MRTHIYSRKPEKKRRNRQLIENDIYPTYLKEYSTCRKDWAISVGSTPYNCSTWWKMVNSRKRCAIASWGSTGLVVSLVEPDL